MGVMIAPVLGSGKIPACTALVPKSQRDEEFSWSSLLFVDWAAPPSWGGCGQNCGFRFIPKINTGPELLGLDLIFVVRHIFWIP